MPDLTPAVWLALDYGTPSTDSDFTLISVHGTLHQAQTAALASAGETSNLVLEEWHDSECRNRVHWGGRWVLQ